MARLPKTEQIFVRTDTQLREQLSIAANVLDQDMSSFIREAIKERLTRLSAENRDLAKALRKVA